MVKPIQIGVLGGGQLGYMLAEAALPYNQQFNFLDADKNCSCVGLAKNFINGSLYDREKIIQLSEISDLLTYEIEHVCIQTLKELEEQGVKIIPSSRVLEIIQDKQNQKEVLKQAGLPTVPFKEIITENDIDWVIDNFNEDNYVCKSRTGGYDGKGVKIVSKVEMLLAKQNPIFDSPYFVEKCISNPVEIAVIIARDANGKTIEYPAVEMVFDPKANLVDYLFSPSKLDSSLLLESSSIAKKAIEAINGIGIFAVELFVDGTNIYINEIAPRPHNSGHHTIEANYTSQYEQLVRILMGLPLGSSEIIKPAIMLNIVGDESFSGEYELSGLSEILKIQGVYLHMYGKKISKPFRKLGHITILNDSLEKGIEVMNFIKKNLKVMPKESL